MHPRLNRVADQDPLSRILFEATAKRGDMLVAVPVEAVTSTGLGQDDSFVRCYQSGTSSARAIARSRCSLIAGRGSASSVAFTSDRLLPAVRYSVST